MNWYASMAPRLALSAVERLKQTPVRITMGLIIASVFWTTGLKTYVLPWLIISTVVQVIEFLSMAPFRRPEPATSRAAVLLALIGAGLFSVAFSVAIVVMWSKGDEASAAIAVMALAGTLVSNIVSGVASRRLFVVGAGPYVVALLSMPLTAPPSNAATQIPLGISACLLVLAVIAIWSRLKSSRQREMQALAEAEHRLAQAEQAMADRAAMAAIVSHELRTPVSAILAGAHVIRHGDRPEATPDTAQLIMDAGRLMTGMLNDLLDHSKIEARGMTLESRDFDLAAFVTETVRFWSASAAEKGLAIEAPDLAPTWLKGDPFRLRQIVNNLMSNALKFTPSGRIRLEVAGEDTPQGIRLCLVVRDEGAGIPDAAMARLFSPFAQGSAQVARNYGGTGLGLTVSRDLARLMGGELTAANNPTGGAAFTLTVILPLGEPTLDADDAAPVAPVLGRRLRVLAVDDHEINRRTLGLVLQPLDVDLATASDGASALAILATEPFDVVLMDVNMPGIDGNEATRRLRASAGLNAVVPVIGFSAGTEAEQIAACRDAGMTDWLAKPLEPARLYEALERATRVVAA